MPDDRDRLLRKAQITRADAGRARRLSNQLTSTDDRGTIEEYAAELDAKAAELEQRADELDDDHTPPRPY